MRAAGWLAVAAALAFLGGSLPSLALFALAIGIVVVLAGAAGAVVLARARLAVTRLIAEREIREDEPLRLRFDVALPGWLPARLHVQVGERIWEELGEDGGTVELPIWERGAYQIDASRLRLSDSLGIFRRTVWAGEPERLLVLPVPDTSVIARPALGLSAEETEPDGLRPYVPGSPVSRIHWLSLARGRGLHERRLAPPPAGLPLVVVDTAGAIDPQALDWVARVAAGCVLMLSRDGGCEVLLPGDATPATVKDEASWRDMHRRLALLETFSEPPPGSAAATVVRFPEGLALGPPPPPPPPGVVPLYALEGWTE